MKMFFNQSLKSYNTFGLDTKADFLVEVASLTQLMEVLGGEIAANHKVHFLGGGSNVLLCQDIKGLVIVNKIKGTETIKENEDEIFLKSFSGDNWHEFVMECIGKNYGGIENLALIPGSVGASPMQNIGAYGVELKDVFVSLEALNLDTLTLETFDNTACQFGYRESVFKRNLKGKYFIYSVTFRLSKKNHKINTSYGDVADTLVAQKISPTKASIKDISQAVIAIRKSKLPDPKVLGNSGSFFKNPVISKAHFDQLKAKFPNIKGFANEYGVKVPAGWLIESLGWKGKKVGNTGSHAQQALVLVNYGNASGNEVKNLAFDIIESVKNAYNIDLEAEVNIIP